MRHATVAVVVSASLLLAFGAAPASAAKGGGVKKHDVDLTWKPKDQDIVSGSEAVHDTFSSFGPPFDDWDPAHVETSTPRDQVGQDTRTGTWFILFGKAEKRAQCDGRFKIERDVIETNPSLQTIEYQGRVWIQRCIHSRRFAKLEPGKLGDLDGETTCTGAGCTGRLDIFGEIRY